MNVSLFPTSFPYFCPMGVLSYGPDDHTEVSLLFDATNRFSTLRSTKNPTRNLRVVVNSSYLYLPNNSSTIRFEGRFLFTSFMVITYGLTGDPYDWFPDGTKDPVVVN